MIKKAAGLALASLISANAKADMFGNVPDYSSNNRAYAEETPAENTALLYESSESSNHEAPFFERDMLEMPELEMPEKEATIEDYLETQGIEPEYIYTTNWWEYPINIGGSFLLTVAWHELGHYIVANMVGAKDVEMHLFDGQCEGNIACIRRRVNVCRDYLCRSIDRELGQLQDTLISAAGMGFTTIGNVSLTSLLQNDALPDWARSFAATTSLMMMMDRHRYIWFSGVKHFAGIENNSLNDVANIVNRNFSSSTARDAAYGILMAASAIELGLRWEEIWYLVNTAIGREVEVPDGLGIMPGLYPYGSNVMLGASGEF